MNNFVNAQAFPQTPQNNGNKIQQQDVSIDVVQQNKKLLDELDKLRGEISHLKQLQMDQSNFQSRITRMVGQMSST